MPSAITGMTTIKANMLRNGGGVAHRMAPGAHIAICKDCLFNGYYNSDIVEAMDATVGDGVEVLLVSLDGLPVLFYDDAVVSSSFRVVEKDISVIFAVRNNGPLETLWPLRLPRGPNLTNPSILKQAVIAPGVNIIATWPHILGPSGLLVDSRRVNFTVMSGTSMACPDVSIITSLIHSANLNWSPTVITSAIMTTADVAYHYRKPIMGGNVLANYFAMGSGHMSHINLDKAVKPRLIYDIRPTSSICAVWDREDRKCS
ncbi:hypothetical protein Cgig2_021488 [Carnegiea gigantea]|uniref:Peptidase S8/S53 domain-containing protein n=1 Tax=Carnegiea gigantea TaxID=171969 RepID=A0A9Q1KFB3_9CARY|nr:hypothetical protein Cgig2_021488 [Carnegiea gigantea]